MKRPDLDPDTLALPLRARVRGRHRLEDAATPHRGVRRFDSDERGEARRRALRREGRPTGETGS
jgi:hypothetical protein